MDVFVLNSTGSKRFQSGCSITNLFVTFSLSTEIFAEQARRIAGSHENAKDQHQYHRALTESVHHPPVRMIIDAMNSDPDAVRQEKLCLSSAGSR